MIFYVCWIVLHVLMLIVDVLLVRALLAYVCDRGVALMEGPELIEDDLPQDKLVCQAVDTPVLDLYFCHTSRSSHLLPGFPIVARDQQEEHRLVFMSCICMSSYKESEDSHITPSVYGVALYENFTVDIPTLMYLCVLDVQGSGTLVAKMIDSMWTRPTYMDELIKTVTTLSEVLDGNLVQCCVPFDLGSNQLPLVMELVECSDDAIYAFLEVPPSTTCQYFHDSLVVMRDETGLDILDTVNLVFSTSGMTVEGTMIRGGHRPDGAYIPVDGAIGGTTGFATEWATGVVSVPDDVYQVELSMVVFQMSWTVHSNDRSHHMVKIWQVH